MNHTRRREELARLLTSRPDTTLDLDGAGGVTALHLAAAGGWDKCAVNLLENRASPVIRNDKGQVLIALTSYLSDSTVYRLEKKTS